MWRLLVAHHIPSPAAWPAVRDRVLHVVHVVHVPDAIECLIRAKLRPRGRQIHRCRREPNMARA